MELYLTNEELTVVLKQCRAGYASLGERYNYNVVPVYKGSIARKILTGCFGLPNAWPSADAVRLWGPVNATFKSTACLFVDDARDGEVICLWEES